MLKLKPANILILVAVVAALGGIAWKTGWLAHSLFDRQAAPPEPTVPPTATPTSTAPAPTAVPSSPPTVTLRPTSTPAPTLIPTPTESWMTVEFGEGLYKVCRRHCLGQWPGDDVPPSLEEYAREVARVNGLKWGLRGPKLKAGQTLRIPPCPSTR